VTLPSAPEIKLLPPKPRAARTTFPADPPSSPVAAALIAGLAIYLPIFGLRGGLVCLMPAIAWRSWRLAAWGFVCGVLAEAATIRAFDWGWNVHEPFSGLIVDYLPPPRGIVFPNFSSLANSVNFVVGLVGWSAMMFTIWYALWPGRKSWFRYVAFVVVTSLGVTGSAIWLWSTAPDGFSGYLASSPANDLVARRFLLFPYFFALPPALAIAGWALSKVTSSDRRP